MIGVLIVTHGALADELLAAARTIAAEELPSFRALSLDWKVGLEEARERISRAASEIDEGSGVIVLTDMFGDTPSNAAFSLAREGSLEVVTGVNLPMVVRLGCAGVGMLPLRELARAIELKGRRSICRAEAPRRGGEGA